MLLEDFDKINGELKLYNEKLATRPQVVVANKMDILEDESVYLMNFKNDIRGIEDTKYLKCLLQHVKV